jgi:NAD(P)-dependent dehydrogenase (short-subunit alcohol dehydrogenase family)
MKTIVITGASRGIGKATAEKFLDEGWKVIGTSIDGNGWEHKNISCSPAANLC